MTDSMPTYFSWMLLVVSGQAQNHECKSSVVKSFPPTFQYSSLEKKVKKIHLAFLKYCLWAHTSLLPDLEGISSSTAVVAKEE